jgi:hypothetical protein
MVNDINKKIKRMDSEPRIGSITVEKLQAQLYFYIFHRTFNEYIAHVLSGKDSDHELPSSYYNGVPTTELNQNYLIYLDTLDIKETSKKFKL